MSMKIAIEIGNDQDVRQFLKDLIAAEVRAITREELRQITIEALRGRNHDTSRVEIIAREEIAKLVKETFKPGWYATNAAVKAVAEQTMESFMENGQFEKLVEHAANVKVIAIANAVTKQP